MPQIGQRPHNPIIAPGPILLGHANNQPLNCLVDPRLAWASMLRAIELAGDEPSVPCQDGVRQGGSRHLAECLATQSTANLAQLRSLCVRELQPPLQLAPQNPVFSSQILIPQQQLLVHRPRNVGQDTCPLHESPPICPPIREGALDRPKKPSGRHAARLRRDGITARLSCSFNFLATRAPLASRAQHVHDAVDDIPRLNFTLAAPALRRRNERPDMRPFFVRHIARISQMIALVARPVLARPHRQPSSQAADVWITSDSYDSTTFETDT